MTEQKSEKTMVAAALLCFLLGGFSAHRFYSGKIGTALFQMALVIAGVVMVASGAAGAMTGGGGGSYTWIPMLGRCWYLGIRRLHHNTRRQIGRWRKQVPETIKNRSLQSFIVNLTSSPILGSVR